MVLIYKTFDKLTFWLVISTAYIKLQYMAKSMWTPEQDTSFELAGQAVPTPWAAI